MKVIYVANEDGQVKLVAGDRAVPHPGQNQLLIQVVAAGVTTTELLWYPTTHTKEGGPRTHAIPGHEFSGIVAAVGSDVRDYAVGDEVYGMNDWFEDGATAEFCLAVPSGIARKPFKLSHADAAAVPIAALTAWQGLFSHGNLKAGDRLLVHGGAGSVGTFVIQLAKLHGADVIATASAKNAEFVRSLKADQVIDYEKVRFEDVVSNVDLIFDAVGGDSLERSWPLLVPTGRAVTIAANSESTTDPRVKAAFFIVLPDHEQLAELGPLFDAGYLRPYVGITAPLNEAPQVYSGAKTRVLAHGKAVITMA